MQSVGRSRQPVGSLMRACSRSLTSPATTNLARRESTFSNSVHRSTNQPSAVSERSPHNTPTTNRATGSLSSAGGQAQQSRPARPFNAMEILSNSLSRSNTTGNATSQLGTSTSSVTGRPQPQDARQVLDDSQEPYHLNIYSHKHNTHVTVTKPNREYILSVSCGQLGFKHSKRKLYDSAYQLGAYAIDRLHQGNWHNKINRLEVVLRGFGPGREAVTKVLMSNEGRLWRPKVVRVSDATRLKFGGTRAKRPRRL